MLKLPLLTRAFAVVLLALGLYLALENTVISSHVLGDSSGATEVTAFAVAVAATGLELIFASWLRSEKGLAPLAASLRSRPVSTGFRLLASGIGLGLVYHFDLLTTARHPAFASSEFYFFGVIVVALVFGPEACIVIASWLWMTARDVETRQLDQNSVKDAENRRLKTKRERMISLAEQAGESEAIETARKRWGANSDL